MEYCSLRRATDPHQPPSRPRRGGTTTTGSDATPDAAARPPTRRATFDVPPAPPERAVAYRHSASTAAAAADRRADGGVPAAGSECQAVSSRLQNHLSFRRGDEADFPGLDGSSSSLSSNGAGDGPGRGVNRMESQVLTDPAAERNAAYGNIMNLMKIREEGGDGSSAAAAGVSADCSGLIEKASKVCPPVGICRDNDDEESSGSCSGSCSGSSNITETSSLSERARLRRQVYFRRCARGMAVLVALAAVSGTVRYLVEDGSWGTSQASEGMAGGESKLLRGLVEDAAGEERAENVEEKPHQALAKARRHRRTMSEDIFYFEREVQLNGGQLLQEDYLIHGDLQEYDEGYPLQDNAGYPVLN